MQFLGFWRTVFAPRTSAAAWKVAAVCVLTALLSSNFAPAAYAKAKFAAVTVDARNGKVLYSENADAIRHPASLTKMMTLYVLFQDLKAGKIKLGTPIRMSARAASMAPSKLGVRAGKSITVETAIRALVVKSANDVAAAVAENLGGTEQAFAKRMTRTARSIGMTHSVFVNASGLPNSAQITTARDMATLGLRLMRDFPQYYPYFRTQSFVFNGRTIRGHNRLLGKFQGTDGIKTGYINASGFNLVTSVKRGNKRLVGVVLGGKSGGSRDAYMKTMLSRFIGKASNGRTIAAIAGSSKGAIDPVGNSVSETPVSRLAGTGGQKRPKSSIFGSRKQAEPEAIPDAALEPDETERQVVAAMQANAPEEGDTAEGDTAGAADTGQGQTIQQVLAETPEPNSARSGVELQAPAAPARPTVVEAGLVDPSLPAQLPFAVKSPEQQASDSQQAAALPEAATDWSIQIGTYASKPDAQAKLLQLRKKLPDVLAGKTAQTVAVQKGSKVTYRARFTGFDQTTARSACQQVAKNKSACQVHGPT